MRGLGVVLLFGSVLSVPKPSLWDTLDNAGNERILYLVGKPRSRFSSYFPSSFW